MVGFLFRQSSVVQPWLGMDILAQLCLGLGSLDVQTFPEI